MQSFTLFTVAALYILSINNEASTIDVLPMLLIPRSKIDKTPNSESILWGKESPHLDITISSESVNTASPLVKRTTSTTENPVIIDIVDETKNDSVEIKPSTTAKPKRKALKINRDELIINSNKPKPPRQGILVDNEEIAVAKIISDVNFMLSNDEKSGSKVEKPRNNRDRLKANKKQNRPSVNECENCVATCDEEKAPICAKPISDEEPNPDTLKGFPSVCHMNCFNICRKIKYELFAEGKCGRFRNRVKTLDSDKKLSRTELDLAKYDVHHDSSGEVAFVPTNI